MRLIVMTCQIFLPECFIYGYGAGYGNIQRLNDPYLRYDKVSISHGPEFLAYPGMLITANKGGALGKIDLMHSYGIAAKVGSIDFGISFPKLLKTSLGIGKLVYGKPFGRTGRTATA